MLEAHHILEAERLAELGGQFHGLVVDRIRPVEADQRAAAVVAAEQLGGHHDPQRVVGIVAAEEDRDLELVVDAHLVQQETQQDRPGVEIQHRLDAVLRVVIQQFVHPLQGVLVRLADAAEIAGDGLRAAQVRVRAVGALGVQRLHVRSAENLHRSREWQAGRRLLPAPSFCGL